MNDTDGIGAYAQAWVEPDRERRLALLERARGIMGGGSLSSYVRTSSLGLTRGLLEAATDAGIGQGEGSWDRSALVIDSLVRKP